MHSNPCLNECSVKEKVVEQAAENKKLSEQVRVLTEGLEDMDFQSGCSWCEKNIEIQGKALTTEPSNRKDDNE